MDFLKEVSTLVKDNSVRRVEVETKNFSNEKSDDNTEKTLKSNKSSHCIYKTKCWIKDFEGNTMFDGSMILEGEKYKWVPDINYSLKFFMDIKTKNHIININEDETVKCRYNTSLGETIFYYQDGSIEYIGQVNENNLKEGKGR